MDELMRRFASMGVHARVTKHSPGFSERRRFNGRVHRWETSGEMPDPVRVDVQKRDGAEFFDLHYRADVDLEVLDLDRRDRHLLLGVRAKGRGGASEENSVFLCGHDEKSWFVAAILESAYAQTVQDAKDALKPAEVWEAMREHGVPMSQRDSRKTAAFVRQGEWFFIPRVDLRVNEREVLRSEPIQRGGGKPHLCQILYRTSGETVWVHETFPNGLTRREYFRLSYREREARGWRQMTRDAHAYVRGTVRHEDHKTIWLKTWHEVVMNTETRSRAMAQVAFLD